MRSTLVWLISTLVGALGASPCDAQTRVASLDELRRELAPGDTITVVPAGGQPVTGRLTRFGADDLDVRPVNDRGRQDVTIPLDVIQSLERRRDSSRNGAAIGAGVGAGVGGAMFLAALATDRNEIDEWAPVYGGAAAICAGIGALIGWATDAANSKPAIRFDVRPLHARSPGIGLAVSFSR